MFDKNRWEGIKVFWEVIRIPISIVILIILFIFPSIIGSLVDRAGFRVDQFELAGIKLAAKTSSADLEALAAKLKKVTADVDDRDKILREAVDQVKPETKMKISALLEAGKNDIAEIQKTATLATEQAISLQTALQKLSPPSAPSGDVPGSSLFVFGADRDQAAALDEIRRAQPALAGSGAILALFHKGSFYRSTAIFSSDAARSQAITALELGIKRSGESFSLLNWCPGSHRAGEAKSPDSNMTVPIYQC